MMKPMRCQICGEVYLGDTVPDRCPFCGAAGRQMVHAAEWIDYGKLNLDQNDMEKCRTALGFEISNWTFYKCCADKSENIFNQAIFKRLAKQEMEHAEVLARMMGEEMPGFTQESCPDNDKEKFEEAHLREHRAIKYYLQSAAQGQDSRVREIFRALAEIETEHLQISNVYK
ncbi:ferritin family protein [Desulfoscipio gibsoniae]|uniref:Rubrerythrin n=1 Tax=Desulfoscipio gibsoniae DSM 7213 TaxID=767817 RepID=R4KK54_9FIRM|nr:ferritin family protein [Desulfoscipio gibsoniae]AGL03578.1 Rubrerythrin [Desulfoscipio gibsoniae DSM 7213]